MVIIHYMESPQSGDGDDSDGDDGDGDDWWW